MTAITSELWSALTDIEQINSELDALNTLLGYLTEEIERGATATSGDSVKATAFVGRVTTFSKMLFAVNTGITTQLKALEESADTCYDCVKTMKERENRG